MNDDVNVPPELRPPRGMASGVGGGWDRVRWPPATGLERKEIDGDDGRCLDRSRRALVWMSFNL